MTKIDIFSGFLGAGKTTLIKKLITEAYAGEKLVLIEIKLGDRYCGSARSDSGMKGDIARISAHYLNNVAS